MPAARVESAGSVAARIGLFYAAYFAVVGVHLPFWPAWLEAQGLGKGDLGWLMASGCLVVTAAGPLMAQVADRRGDRRKPILAIAWSSAAVFALFAFGGFWWLLAVSLLFAAVRAALSPLGESLAVLAAREHGLDYGRLRLWGSCAFIAVAAASGQLLVRTGIGAAFALVFGLLLLLAAVCHLLPDARPPRPPEHAGAARGPLRRLLVQPLFLCFLCAASLVQASHAAYYGFATLLWQDAGLSKDVIGWLWAEGVIAEIALFASGPWLARRVRATSLLLLAACGAVVRWTVSAASADVAWLALVQPLHALSFAATHLGAVRFIAERVPHDQSATAQSLYAGLAHGGVLGCALVLAGQMVEQHGLLAYRTMALMAAAGGLAAVALAVAPRGPRGPRAARGLPSADPTRGN